jgi:hypothetical protein
MAIQYIIYRELTMKISTRFLPLMALLAIFCIGCSKYENDPVVGVRDGQKISNGTVVRFQLYRIYPTPVHKIGEVRFMVYSPQHLRISIYNEDWQEMKVVFDADYNSGIFEETVSTQDLPNGIFYIVAKGDSETQMISFINIR